jgi:catechol 2,3-dioxygenase-like lactoylglutathione lyase family enzyme
VKQESAAGPLIKGDTLAEVWLVIKGLHHVAVRTTDIERAAKFYADVLGFEEVLRLHFEGGDYLIQMVRDGSMVELFGGGKPTTEDRNEVGFTHIALTVDSVDDEHERLKNLGCEFYIQPQTVQGIRCAFFYDPDGNRIEIIE